MRIGVGATHISASAPSGLNRYSTGVIDGLVGQHSNSVVFAADPEIVSRYGHRAAPVRPRFLRRGNFSGNLGRLVWSQLRLESRLARDGCDVYYSPVPEGSLRPRVPQVITIHDFLPILFPEDNPRLKHYYRVVLPRLVAASAAVIAVSESTRADLNRLLGDQGKPIHVVHQGFRSELFRPRPDGEVDRVRQKFGLDNYFLSVGETRRYKNVRGLIEAFVRLRPRGVTLAIVGKVNRLDPEIQQLPMRLGVSEQVRFLGVVGDDELAALYSGAKAFVFPSLYEGFGIPPLEAMGSGCPVITSRRASLPEVCGDAAIYVDPEDIDSIVRGMASLLDGSTGTERLKERGIARAATFSYDAMAARTLEIIESVSGRFRAGSEPNAQGASDRSRPVGSRVVAGDRR